MRMRRMKMKIMKMRITKVETKDSLVSQMKKMMSLIKTNIMTRDK